MTYNKLEIDTITMSETTIDHDPDQPPIRHEPAQILAFDPRAGAGLKCRTATRTIGAAGHGTAQEGFDDYRSRLGWDFQKQADILLNYCTEEMIAPLLRYIEDSGQTEDFADFLAINFEKDNQLNCQSNGVRLSPTQTGRG
jgi:hypothetical protein